eukprot:Nk52_evm84s1810 gene=Nk52_evmTU84s1810
MIFAEVNGWFSASITSKSPRTEWVKQGGVVCSDWQMADFIFGTDWQSADLKDVKNEATVLEPSWIDACVNCREVVHPGKYILQSDFATNIEKHRGALVIGKPGSNETLGDYFCDFMNFEESFPPMMTSSAMGDYAPQKLSKKKKRANADYSDFETDSAEESVSDPELQGIPLVKPEDTRNTTLFDFDISRKALGHVFIKK